MITEDISKYADLIAKIEGELADNDSAFPISFIRDNWASFSSVIESYGEGVMQLNVDDLMYLLLTRQQGKCTRCKVRFIYDLQSPCHPVLIRVNRSLPFDVQNASFKCHACASKRANAQPIRPVPADTEEGDYE